MIIFLTVVILWLGFNLALDINYIHKSKMKQGVFTLIPELILFIWAAYLLEGMG